MKFKPMILARVNRLHWKPNDNITVGQDRDGKKLEREFSLGQTKLDAAVCYTEEQCIDKLREIITERIGHAQFWPTYKVTDAVLNCWEFTYVYDEVENGRASEPCFGPGVAIAVLPARNEALEGVRA